MKSKNPFLYKVVIDEPTWDSWSDDDNGISWCYNQFGTGGYQKGSRWSCDLNLQYEDTYLNSVTFRFRDKNAYMLFVEKFNLTLIQPI